MSYGLPEMMLVTIQVGQSDIERLERRVGTINSIAKIERAQNADVPVDYVLGVGGFDLDRIADEVCD